MNYAAAESSACSAERDGPVALATLRVQRPPLGVGGTGGASLTNGGAATVPVVNAAVTQSHYEMVPCEPIQTHAWSYVAKVADYIRL